MTLSRQADNTYEFSDNGQPIYRQVALAIEHMIIHDYKAGDYLPSENELALHFSVNRHTVRRAIDDLVNAGFVLRQKGKGSLIINDQIEYPLSSGRFTTGLDMLRRTSVSQIIKTEVVSSSPKIAKYLGVNISAPVIVIETLRIVDDVPMSLISHYLNSELVPDIHRVYEGGSLHECIDKMYGLKLRRVSALISASMPTNEDALHLKSSLVLPLLKVKSFNAVEDDLQKIVELSISRSRSDRFQIKIPCI
jgi:GntR family phosphonate transport system transcriptional regulator